MAYVRTMYKSIKINKYQKYLELEKQACIELSKGIKPKYKLKLKYQHFLINLRRRIIDFLTCKCIFPKRSCFYKTIFNLKHDGTCENFTLKSVVGFIGGSFLTYIFFMFFVFQLNFKLSTATIMCSLFGIILTIGLAFSFKVRCIVFLLLPQFFSKRGRQAVIAYAFILAITGPAKNTLHNVGILSESMACGQEQLKAAVRQIIDVIKKPFYAIRDAIRSIVKTVKVIVKKIKEVLLTIKRIIMSLVKVIKSAFEFLGKILNICNKELGTPFQRCTKVFEDAITDCNAKLGPLFDWLCSITYLVQSVCYIVKVFDYICLLVEFISDSVIGVVLRKVKLFIRHVKTMFYVRIKFSHSFHFETNQSKSMTEITKGIVTEIRQRSEHLLTVFDVMSCATSLFFLFIILRVLHYRFKYLTNDRFDNRYITTEFRLIDMKRAQQEKETILPLNHRERSLYIEVTSIRLVKVEKVKLSKAAVALGTTSLKLCTHMMVDYALYWVLTVIRYHSRFQSKAQAPNVVQLNIEGQGFLASLLRSIVKAFQPLGVALEIDTIPCLPDPIPPDYDRYIQIVSLLALCWILTMFEPYGLRLRHSVMSYYHPVRARQRSIWLYNHILRSRSSFLKFARRQLRRKMTGTKQIAKVTCKEYLQANINSKWILMCLGSPNETTCLLCGDVFRESDSSKPIRCAKPDCPGIYCEQCFKDLQNLCTICMEPIQYGDLSDISEERDSSEEERSHKLPKKKKKKKCTLSKCCKGNSKDDSDDDTDEHGGGKINKSDSEEIQDSDYDSDDVSTENSYSYQDVKDLNSDVVDSYKKSQFSDVEKQKVHDDASWDTFKRDLGTYDEDNRYDSEYDENKEEENYNKSFRVDTSTSHSSVISEIEFFNVGQRNSKTEIKPEDNQQISNYPSSYSTDVMKYEQPLAVVSESSHSTPISVLQPEELPSYQASENISLKHSQPTVKTNIPLERETTFTETDSSLQVNKGCCPLCRTKNFLKHMCHRSFDVPRLNLDFSSQESLSPHSTYDSLQSALDSFRKKVKYEHINETSKSFSSTLDIGSPNTLEKTPKSSLHIGYEVFVPRHNKYLDTKSLLNVTKNNKSKTSSTTNYKNKVIEHKNLQRRNRPQQIAKHKQKTISNSSELTIDIARRSSSILAHTAQTTQTPSVKARDYYKRIKNIELASISEPTKKNSRFINIFKNIFLKEKKCRRISGTSKSALLSNKYEGTSKTLSPVLVDLVSSPEDSQNISSSLATSNNHSSDDLSPNSLNIITGTSSSLMGSVFSHQRGGGDYALKYFGIDDHPEITDGRRTSSSQKYDVSDSSDSEESNLGIYFGSEVPDKYKRSPVRRKSNSETISMQNYSKSELSISETKDKHSRSASLIDSNLKSNSTTDEVGRRYSRQPAERDENPKVEEFRPMKLFSNDQSLNNDELNLNKNSCKCKKPHKMSDRYCCSEINSPIVDEIRSRCIRRIDTDQSYRDPNNSYTGPPSRPKVCACSPKNKMDQNRSQSHSYPRCCDRNNEKRQKKPCQLQRSCLKPPRSPPECRCCCCCKSSTGFNPLRRQSSDYAASNFEENCAPCRQNSIYDDVGTTGHHQQDNFPCTCYKAPSPLASVADDDGCCSECSGGSEFPDLVYQNRDEFLDLVSELGDTLSLRNKERVQRAIRQFEMNSRLNKNLERPVFTDESDDSSERRACCRKPAMCIKCRKKKRSQNQCPTKLTNISTRKEHLSSAPPCYTAEQPRSHNKYKNNPEGAFPTLSNAHPKFQQNISSTHWEIDPRTGEWYKVYNNYSYEDDYYLQLPLVPPSSPKRCTCDVPRQLCSRNSPDRNSRSCSPSQPPSPPLCCRCNNCGFFKERY